MLHYKANLIYNDLLKSKDLKDVTQKINLIVDIYKSHDARTKKEIKKREFKNVFVKGIEIDWNTFYHDQEYKIKEIYFDALSHLHGLEYEQKGFTVIDL